MTQTRLEQALDELGIDRLDLWIQSALTTRDQGAERKDMAMWKVNDALLCIAVGVRDARKRAEIELFEHLEGKVAE